MLIDFDFWHKYPKRFIMPVTNYDYWNKKIAGNVTRDKKVTKELKSQGWKVVRVWEYDVKHNFEKIVIGLIVVTTGPVLFRMFFGKKKPAVIPEDNLPV